MKVLTPVLNNPTFIEIQYKTLKKYMKCDYEFIVFNDAKRFPDYSNFNNPDIFDEIEETCKRLGIKSIPVDNQHHQSMTDAAIRCSDSYNFILDYQKKNPDKYLVLDSDMFLIDYLNPHEHFNGYNSAVVLQSRNIDTLRPPKSDGLEYCPDSICNYFWNGIFYFDMNNLNSIDLLDWQPINGTDVGGRMWKWLKTQVSSEIPTAEQIRFTEKAFTDEKLYYIRHLWSCSWDSSELPDFLKNNTKVIDFIKNDPRNMNGKFFCEIYDNKFLHYRAGGNWRGEGMNLHKDLSDKLSEAFEI